MFGKGLITRSREGTGVSDRRGKRTRRSGDFKCTGFVPDALAGEEEKDRLEEGKTRKEGKSGALQCPFNVSVLSLFLCGSSITTWEALRRRRLSLGLNGVFLEKKRSYSRSSSNDRPST